MKFKYFLILFSIFLFERHQITSGQDVNKKNTKIIVIDPGHGGKDTGAIGKNGKEKDIVLAISLQLGKYIEENLKDVKVIYTRKTDTFIELHKRAEIANQNKADLFISIHVNSNKSTKPYGTETYAMGLHKTKGNLEVAQKENSVIMIEEDYSAKYEGFDPNSPESYIIFSLLQNVFLEHSLDFAAKVQGQFENRAKRENRGVKQAGFLVLWKTTMPSVLIETGFISNSTEEKYLLSKEGQDYIASAIYRAVRDYFSLIELNNLDNIPTHKDTIVKDSIPKPIIVDSTAIVYCIQIAASSVQLIKPQEYFKGLNVKEYKVGKYYKYAIYQNNSYKQVKDYLPDIRQKYPDAFIIAFDNNKSISVKKALEKSKSNIN